MKRIIETPIRLFCGFCSHSDNYTKRKTISAGKKKGVVSNTIKCNKCNRNLNQDNKLS